MSGANEIEDPDQDELVPAIRRALAQLIEIADMKAKGTLAVPPTAAAAAIEDAIGMCPALYDGAESDGYLDAYMRSIRENDFETYRLLFGITCGLMILNAPGRR